MNAITPTTKTVTLQDLIWVCSTLCDLLEIENQALTKHDTSIVRELAENKGALTKLYEQTYISLGSDKDIKEKALPEELASLQELGQRLNTLMVPNALMLKAEIEARKRVMDVFVNAAKKQNENTLNYSKKGYFPVAAGAKEHAALAYNHTL